MNQMLHDNQNNKDITAEQKLILFEDGTEAPGTE